MSAADHVDDILEPLETINSRGFGRYDVFRDWVGLMLEALQRNDEAYLEIMDRYDRGRDREEGQRNADLFSAAFGELQVAMQESNRDLLGDASEAFGMGNDHFGQHFTPHNLCEMMADLQTADDPDPPVTIGDPACGSGRLVIYAARQIDERTFCYGQDKDELCAKMAALNFCFFNLDGVVIHGDSLTVEKLRAWRTSGSMVGGEVAEVDPENVPLPESALGGAEREDDPEERVDVATPDDGGLEQSDLDQWGEA